MRRRGALFAAWAAATCALLVAGPASADPTIWVEHGHVGPLFVDRPVLALSGGTLAVGRPGESNQAGAVHIFGRVGATYAESAVLPSPTSNGGFGERLALAGDTLAVGMFGPPQVLLYRRENGGWTSAAQIDVSPLASVERVAIDASTLAVRDSTGLQIYAFDGATWTLSQTVALPLGTSLGDLAFASGRLFVGVPFEETLGVPTGAVHVYEPVSGVWTETQRLTASDAADFDSFGVALAAEGDRLVVGSLVGTHGAYKGAAYVFEREASGFVEVARLTGVDPAASDKFGASVALRGDVVAVGALWGTDFGETGQVSLFERGNGGWPRSQLITPAPIDQLHFGRSLALAEDTLLVADEQTGVWFYPVVGTPCTTAGDCGTGVCADGVCCETSCAAQCMACDVPGAVGLCTFFQGAPHPGHEPCGASCEAGVATSAGSCVVGESLCVGVKQALCEPYACGETACLTSCARDADCQSGFRCDTAISTCVPTTAEICDAEHSLVRADGSVATDCSPYRCAGVTCLEVCATSGDCVEGFACDSSQRCVAVETAETGCSCSLAGASAVRGPWWIALALASLARRRRCRAA